VDYYHVVFTLPAAIADIAYQNKRVVYGILFKAAAETLRTIALDPKHLGAKIGVTMVLHTWGSALTHHPHVHCIIPGGGFSADNQRWIACRKGFFLPVRVLSRLFRRLFLSKLGQAYRNGDLHFFGHLSSLNRNEDFTKTLLPLYQQEWVVYAKRPFAGPKSVLAYLSRYTHRVAIANSRLVKVDSNVITFKWKDYREKEHRRAKTMTLSTDEFIRRFLLHVLPRGLHRIRYYGFFANTRRTENLNKARALLTPVSQAPEMKEQASNSDDGRSASTFVCPLCSAPMIIIETFERGQQPRAPPIRREAA